MLINLIKTFVPIGVALISTGAFAWYTNSTLNITVLDEVTKLPVSDAHVTIEDSSSVHLTKISGTDGVVMFKKPDIKIPVHISVIKTGYDVYQVDANSEEDPKLRNVRLHKSAGWTKIEKKGSDGMGTATFSFHTLIGVGNGYRWKFKSDSTIEVYEAGNKKIKTGSAKEFFNNKLPLLQIEKNVGIIAVGNASCEGNTADEGVRARKRADVIRDSIQEKFSNRVYQLILGKYQDDRCSSKNPEDTLPQRSIIVITFSDATESLDLEKATEDAFTKALVDPEFKKNLHGLFLDKSKSPLRRDLDIHKYTCFDLAVSPPDCNK
jgi:hypothetical protein